jgi:hypothetical protein
MLEGSNHKLATTGITPLHRSFFIKVTANIVTPCHLGSGILLRSNKHIPVLA